MYIQIMEQVKQRVAIGDWPPGQKILSIRELAVGLKVSVITVKRAYLELEREGVIITRHGMGSSIADNADLSKTLFEQELESHLEKIVNLARLLGLSSKDLGSRLREVYQNMPKERS
jgi:GntR family transcriptional regulator